MYLKEAYRRLKKRIEHLPSPIVAFSGGMDSMLLLHAARDVLGKRAAAVTAVAPYIPREQGDYARELALAWGIDYFEVTLPLLHTLSENPPDRCYLCKREMYGEITRLVREHGFKAVLDGTNADDLHAHRPGLEAIRELGIETPLADEGITKDMVRAMLMSRGVPINEAVSGPCLLTRMPYGMPVDRLVLERIERSEAFLHTLGIVTVRVRYSDGGARIEAGKADVRRLLDPKVLDTIDSKLRELGWAHVSLDLGGYRVGGAGEPTS
jgi:uncharacterized protein